MTSVTNGVAFFVGAGTVLPSLSSFCIFAGIAILLLFFFQVTFFSAFVVIDYKRFDSSPIYQYHNVLYLNRQQANLNGFVPCVRMAPPSMTIDEKFEWDLMGIVRDVFSSHIGRALAGSNIVSRAVQVITFAPCILFGLL